MGAPRGLALAELAPAGRPPAAAAEPADAPMAFDPDHSYREARAHWETRFEASYVRWLLRRHAGNLSAAARAARMDRKYLHKLARKHGLR